MATYFVFTPSNDRFPTAEVESPDSRHARTVYLDFLSRNGAIEYSNRGQYRKLVKITRMQPGETQTAVKLSYGESQVPTQILQEVPQPQVQQGSSYSEESIVRPSAENPKWKPNRYYQEAQEREFEEEGKDYSYGSTQTPRSEVEQPQPQKQSPLQVLASNPLRQVSMQQPSTNQQFRQPFGNNTNTTSSLRMKLWGK